MVKQRYVNLIDEDQQVTFKPVKAWDIKIEGWEELDLFVHRNLQSGRWQVSEGKTGASVTGNTTYSRKEEAIARAKEMLDKLGKEAVRRSIEEHIKRGIIAPIITLEVG